MMIRTLASGILAVAASTAGAADNRLVLSGAGSLACKDWKDVRATNNPMLDNIFYSWGQGFFSALNVMRLRAGDKALPVIPKAGELLELIDAGCAESPDLPVFSVALKIYAKLPVAAIKGA